MRSHSRVPRCLTTGGCSENQLCPAGSKKCVVGSNWKASSHGAAKVVEADLRLTMSGIQQMHNQSERHREVTR